MTPRETIIALYRAWDAADWDDDPMFHYIAEWANCQHVDLDDETGDVWIEEPQRGHWLGDDALADLAAWLVERLGQPVSQRATGTAE